MRNCLIAIFSLFALCAQAIKLLPEQVPCAVPDRQLFETPGAVQLEGWSGSRIWASESKRLAQLDTDRLPTHQRTSAPERLGGFHRPPPELI